MESKDACDHKGRMMLERKVGVVVRLRRKSAVTTD